MALYDNCYPSTPTLDAPTAPARADASQRRFPRVSASGVPSTHHLTDGIYTLFNASPIGMEYAPFLL
jgi:hypothetical protein